MWGQTFHWNKGKAGGKEGKGVGVVTHVTTWDGGALGGEKGISKVKAMVGAGATAEWSIKYKIPIWPGPRADCYSWDLVQEPGRARNV